MAEFDTNYITPDIKLSVFRGQLYKTEAIFDHHTLVWLIGGGTKIVRGGETTCFNAGDTFLIPRNHPATFISYADRDGQLHQAAVMHLTVERLKAYYLQHPVTAGERRIGSVIGFRKDPLLASCMASLIPYFEVQGPFPEQIASMKIAEAISVLRVVDPGIDAVLANFEEPGKIGLLEFMEKHYMYNLSLEKFGYLTGRSLSTFNRDFRKLFHTTPQRWLLDKRLTLAHDQLADKRLRPSDVYLEAGFEDLSHFSFAFKKKYGYAPTALSSNLGRKG